MHCHKSGRLDTRIAHDYPEGITERQRHTRFTCNRYLATDMRSLLPERYRLITDIEIVTRKGAALSLVSQAFLELIKESVGSLR